MTTVKIMFALDRESPFQGFKLNKDLWTHMFPSAQRWERKIGNGLCIYMIPGLWTIQKRKRMHWPMSTRGNWVPEKHTPWNLPRPAGLRAHEGREGFLL